MSSGRARIAAAVAVALTAAAVAGAATALLTDDSAVAADLRAVQEAAAGVAADSETPAADLVDALNGDGTALVGGTRVVVADAAVREPSTRTDEEPPAGTGEAPAASAVPADEAASGSSNASSRGGTADPTRRTASRGAATLAPAAAAESAAGEDGAVDVLLGVGSQPQQLVRVVLHPSGTGAPAATVAALTAVGTLVAAGLAAAAVRRRTDEGEPLAADAVRHQPGGDGVDRRPAEQPTAGSADGAAKDRLVDELVDLVPHLPEGLAWRVERALADAGVVSFDGDGDAFDPDRHEAVGTAPALRVEDAGLVASTVRSGFRSASGVVRPARVVVYAPPPGAADLQPASS